jgi:hypothetical protein
MRARGRGLKDMGLLRHPVVGGRQEIPSRRGHLKCAAEKIRLDNKNVLYGYVTCAIAFSVTCFC